LKAFPASNGTRSASKIESNYGMGGKPVSRGFGNITYTASITMDYATQQTLRSTYGSLMDIGEFDLIISFANPMASDDWTTTTVTLKGCIFSEDGMESKQDDTDITHEFDLNPFLNTGWGRRYHLILLQ
jgi:hypothetical protein